MSAVPSAVPSPLVILAADIGGTHARFLLARGDADSHSVIDEATLLVAEHASIEAAASEFVARTRTHAIDRACLAVAGPIEGRKARLTNARWEFDSDAIGAALRIPQVRLCNDFEAAAFGLESVPATAQVVLQAPGTPADQGHRHDERRLLIGAGTGLGVAYVIGEKGDRRIVAGEGGHAAFAPADDEQQALLAWLRPSLGRVSAEHVLSGPGLVRLFAFASRHRGALPDDVESEGAAAVARRHARGEPEAVHALKLFTSIFGAVAGDHALSVLPLRGVFIGGGLAPRFVDAFADGNFIAAFRAKGPHAGLMERIPVFLLCDDRLGLRGAATRALQ